MPNGEPAADGKTACEAFRESLAKLAGSYNDHYSFGDVLQMFDQLHQSHRENTGDKCKAQADETPRASQIDGVPIRIQIYVPAGDSAQGVLSAIEHALKQWREWEMERGDNHPAVNTVERVVFLNFMKRGSPED